MRKPRIGLSQSFFYVPIAIGTMRFNFFISKNLIIATNELIINELSLLIKLASPFYQKRIYTSIWANCDLFPNFALVKQEHFNLQFNEKNSCNTHSDFISNFLQKIKKRY